jgi:hypothetical protein
LIGTALISNYLNPASMTATQTLTLSATESSGQSSPPFKTSAPAERTRAAESSRKSKKRKRSEFGVANEGTTAPRTSADRRVSSPEELVDKARTDSPEVLSHAASRKRRKQEAKAADIKIALDDAPLVSPKKNRSGDQRKDKSISTKRQNSVWVGNLSFQTTQASIKRFFQPAGEITRMHMPMKFEGGNPMNRGYGVR